MIKPRPALFKWRHFEPEIIVCAVRWYLRFSLSYRDVEELLMERGLPADHTSILAVGAALCTRIEQEMPAGVETDQRLLKGRRKVHLPGWELAVPVSCR
jgi:transposase-like protein